MRQPTCKASRRGDGCRLESRYELADPQSLARVDHIVALSVPLQLSGTDYPPTLMLHYRLTLFPAGVTVRPELRRSTDTNRPGPQQLASLRQSVVPRSECDANNEKWFALTKSTTPAKRNN